MAAIVFFALAIRPLGLVVTAFVSFLIAAMGSHETRWVEADHRRRLPDARLRTPVPVRARATAADVPAFRWLQ